MNAMAEDTDMTEDGESDPDTAEGDGALRRTLPIVNRRGLHARASARFVQLAETFDAEITVSRDGLSVGGQSIMGLMMLAAGIGSSIDVSVTGPQASEALEAITALVADRFGEES